MSEILKLPPRIKIQSQGVISPKAVAALYKKAKLLVEKRHPLQNGRIARQIKPVTTPWISGFFAISFITKVNGFSCLFSTKREREITAKTLNKGTLSKQAQSQRHKSVS